MRNVLSETRQCDVQWVIADAVKFIYHAIGERWKHLTHLSLLFVFFHTHTQNANLTWYTDDPDFTPCFQRTALVWLPCGFLWLFALLDVFYIKNSINRNIPWGFLNATKLILTGGLILLSLVDLIVVIVNQDDKAVFPVDFYVPVIKIATFVSIQMHLKFYLPNLPWSHLLLNYFTDPIGRIGTFQSEIWFAHVRLAIPILDDIAGLQPSAASLAVAQSQWTCGRQQYECLRWIQFHQFHHLLCIHGRQLVAQLLGRQRTTRIEIPKVRETMPRVSG